MNAWCACKLRWLPFYAVLAGCASHSAHSGPSAQPAPQAVRSGAAIPPSEACAGRRAAAVATFQAEAWQPMVAGGLAQALQTAPCNPRDPSLVAAFDWDNTMIRNDIGEATLAWMMRHDKLRMPQPGVASSWLATSRFLQVAAAAELAQACATAGLAQGFVRTSDNGACAVALMRIYDQGKTAQGAPAFAIQHPTRGGSANALRIEPAYAWLAQLLAGHTAAELAAFAEATIREGEAAAVGSTQRVGARTMPAWLRRYDAMANLVASLRRAGIEVWIISASPEPIVQIYAGKLGIPATRVIGVRTVPDAQGRGTATLQPCGDDLDVIPFIDGKRCWLNTVAFGLRGPAAWQTPVALWLAAGDANTDATFVKDARWHLVIDRQKPRVMCPAMENRDGRWLIQPMFIEPLPPAQHALECATACTDAAGASVACATE